MDGRTDVDPYNIVQDDITRLVIAIVYALSSCDMSCHNYHVKNTICKITCMRTRKEISPTVEFSNLAASWDSILSGFAVWFIVPEIIGIVINLLQNSLYKAETTHITYISVGLKRCSAMRKICVQLILSKHSTG